MLRFKVVVTRSYGSGGSEDDGIIILVVVVSQHFCCYSCISSCGGCGDTLVVLLVMYFRLWWLRVYIPLSGVRINEQNSADKNLSTFVARSLLADTELSHLKRYFNDHYISRKRTCKLYSIYTCI